MGDKVDIDRSPMIQDPEKGKHSFNLLRRNWNLKLPRIADRFRIVAEQDALNMSLWAVRMGVLADAMNLTILEPNLPFMAAPGAHADSFPNTDPFNFSAATYFIPMTGMLAGAITSAFIGSLSDRIGRRPCFMFCVGMSVITTIIKYLCRENFWPFCITSFINGLFGGSLPVALAYVSDIHPNREAKDAEIGGLIGFNMIGRSGGGIVAILLESEGLFVPLLASAAINALATLFLWVYMIEPDGKLVFEEEATEEENENGEEKPINWNVFLNVNIGSLLDNIGSAGLYPLTLSPLCFETFYLDFFVIGEDPILGASPYRWIYVMVALTVIPGAILSQSVFKKIGPAGGCVVGNFLTAVGIVSCLYICNINPPTRGTLIAYVITLYGIFPFTVLSQLSTGPMLDRLAPPSRRGFAQGVNVTIMNFGTAITPYVFGTMADNAGIELTLWVAIAVSLLACAANTPLIFSPDLRAPEKKDYQQATGLEDQDLVDKAMKGEWVPAQFLTDLNDARRAEGLPYLVIPCTPYEEDKHHLAELKKHAMEDFQFVKIRIYQYLALLDSEPELFIEEIKNSLPKQEVIDKQAEDLGRWFGDYLKDAGYMYHGGNQAIMKQLIMKAFPLASTEKEITKESMGRMCVQFLRVMNDALDKEPKNAATKAFRNSVVM